MKILIIDDESKARVIIKTIVQEYCPEVKAIAAADDLPSGVKTIRKFQPDLVFLDIEMPVYSGIQITEFLDKDEINFQIVFTTAYSEYAIKAFEMNALDYLLKPIQINKVCEAVKRAALLQDKKHINTQLLALKENIEHANFRKIGLPVADGILFVKLPDIVFLEAEGMYTRFYMIDGKDLLVSKPLKHFTGLLAGDTAFFRSHRSYLLNINNIKKWVKKDGVYIVMENGKMVSVAKEKQRYLLDILNALYH